MIRVTRGDLAGVPAECRIRPMRSDGESVSAVGQRLETTAGEAVMARVLGQGDSPVGTAILTPSGGLPGDFLIHVVLQSPDEVATAAVIRRGLLNALRRAADFGIETVALPPLGLGAGNLEAEESAKVMVEVIRDHVSEGRPPLEFAIVVESEFEETVFASLAAAGTSGS